jgi:hypothetical protein
MAHCNTIFHQMLKLIPRHHFAKLEAEHGTGRKSRSFNRWSQLVHLLAMQLKARASLKARKKNLYHLGVKPVARSTFADANSQRLLLRGAVCLDVPALPAAGPEAQIPVQKQALQPGCHRSEPLSLLLALGSLPPHQGRHQTPYPFGP